MFIATMDSTHFSWMGAGDSEAEAQQAIAYAFAKHLSNTYEQTDSPFDALEPFYARIGVVPPEDLSDMAALAAALADYYGIGVIELNPGDGARDSRVVRRGE